MTIRECIRILTRLFVNRVQALQRKTATQAVLETRFSTLGVTAAQRTAPEVEYNLVQKRQQYVSVTLVTYTYSYCQVVLVGHLPFATGM